MTRPLPAPTFGHAAEAFVVAHEAPGAWAKGTAVKYRQTLAALEARLAGDAPGPAADVAALGTPAGATVLEAAFAAAFGTLAPATRARHLSALRSAIAWWTEAGWVTADPTARWARPKVPVDTTRALPRAQVAAIWKLDVPLRDKALWRVLYETAARAEEVLGLDVPDLDLPSKRGRVISKGGSTDWVHWQTGTALLLPRLLAGRREGLVFLADPPGGGRAGLLLAPRHQLAPGQRGRDRHSPSGRGQRGVSRGRLRHGRPGSLRPGRGRPGRARPSTRARRGHRTRR